MLGHMTNHSTQSTRDVSDAIVMSGAGTGPGTRPERDGEAGPGADRGTGGHGHGVPDAVGDPAEFWERRYADADAVWSGRVNASLAGIVRDWEPGRSLDLGCGEGGDVLWLAEQGWDATGIDLSATAIGRARAAAAERGIPNAAFTAADLGEWADGDRVGERPFDLVTASFLQSPVELPRDRILRAAAARVAPGGNLVVISHAAPPPWAEGHRGPGDFPQPEAELASLALDPEGWTVVAAEVREREATGPDGRPAMLEDTVVVARRS